MKAESAMTCMLLIMFVLGGCTIMQPKFQVEVDSFRNSGSEENAYLLLPGEANVMEDNLQFEEYSRYVHRALSMKGYVPAESFEQANVAIFLSYGVGEPQEYQLFYSLPTWDRPIIFSPYTAGRSRSRGRNDLDSDAEDDTQPYGDIGGVSDVVTYTTHLRYMILDAFDLKELRRTEREVQLWRTTVRSTGTNDDLRRVFPVLVAASVPYIATNTENRVRVELDASDTQVVEIRGAGEKAVKHNP